MLKRDVLEVEAQFGAEFAKRSKAHFVKGILTDALCLQERDYLAFEKKLWQC
jgi:hypothetical protein